MRRQEKIESGTYVEIGVINPSALKMAFFRSKVSDRLTPEEINAALSDIYDTTLPAVHTNDLQTIATFTFIGCLVLFSILFILDQIVSKYRNVKTMENDLTNTTRRQYRKKEKQSPFVGPTNTVPQPTFYKLDKAEKGQNISLNYRIPYRRKVESEKPNETKITILVQENKPESLTLN